MEMCNPNGGRTAAPAFPAMLLMIMMLLINAYCCGAAVLAKSNTSFRCSDGRLDECLIKEDLELELEFLMNPYVSRILDTSTGISYGSNNPSKPAISCGTQHDNPAYFKCISKVKPSLTGCDPKRIYPRGCNPPSP